MLGDYHPPLGGFVLLLFALGLIALLEAEPSRSRLAALLGLSVPLALAVNAWVFPLHAILVGAWALYRRWRGEPAHLGMLALGLSLGFVLLYPFLAGLGTAGRALPVHWVPTSAHTPLPQFLALHWPFLVLSVLALIDARTRRLGAYLVLVFGFFLLLSEFVYFGDNGGRYLRFNTTLKWWSWMHVAVVGGIAAIALASTLRAVRYTAVAVLLLLSVFQGFELARYYIYSPKPHFARVGGEGAVTDVPGYHDVLGYLRYAPKGVVLERPGDNQGAYMVTSALSLFSGHAAFLGWPDHLRNWGRPDAEVTRRVVDIETFYSGKMADTLGWLMHNDIRYIVWSESDNTRNPAGFGLVQQQIAARYTWHEYRSGDPWRTGIWARRE
jgi:hypothetical protein